MNSFKFLSFVFLLLPIHNLIALKNKRHSNENLELIEKELMYNKEMKKKFDPSLYKYLKKLKVLEENYPNVTLEERRNPVFVTLMSDRFIPRALVMLKSLLKYFPTSNIIVYDIGLKTKNAKFLKKVCNVIYKKFNFGDYPNHVSNLKTYAFKGIVLTEALRDYKVIWYIDTSITFTRSNLIGVYKAMESKKSSYFLHDNPNHGIIRGTVVETFNYLPSNQTQLMEEKVSMYQSGLTYVVRDNESMKKVVKWFALCSLQENCVSPLHSKKKCNGFESNRYGYNVDNCHRQDQSIINIILWNAYNGNISEYISGYTNFYKIKRYQKGRWKDLKFCKK